jgi:hypothetical protein
VTIWDWLLIWFIISIPVGVLIGMLLRRISLSQSRSIKELEELRRTLRKYETRHPNISDKSQIPVDKNHLIH